MNKLIAALTASDSSIKMARATAVAGRIGLAQQTIVTTLKGRLAKINHEISQLTDLAPTQTTQLSVASENFSPERFVNELHQKRVEAKNVREQLDIALETLAEFGTEEELAKLTDSPTGVAAA